MSQEQHPVDGSFSLRKLPLWGRQVEQDELDFEWPKEVDLGQIGSLVSIEFSSYAPNCDEISSVKCHYSNGHTEHFHVQGSQQFESTELRLDFQRQVRRVAANAHDDPGEIYGITFLDRHGKRLGEYNPLNESRGQADELILAENEEIIGVYGVKDAD